MATISVGGRPEPRALTPAQTRAVCASPLCPWNLPLWSQGQTLPFPPCAATKAFVNALPLGRCCCRCVGECQLCTQHAPPAPSRCTPSTVCAAPAARPGTEICLFTKIYFSNRLFNSFVVLFLVTEWAIRAWKPPVSKGQGRRKAGLTSVHGHGPPAAHCPPRISVPLESCSLPNSCRHWYQLSWERVHGVCPPSASPGPSPWMLPAKPPRPPLRHSVLAGIPGQSTHTRGSDRSRRFL